MNYYDRPKTSEPIAMFAVMVLLILTLIIGVSELVKTATVKKPVIQYNFDKVRPAFAEIRRNK